MAAQQNFGARHGMAVCIEIDRHDLVRPGAVAHGQDAAVAGLAQPVNADQAFRPAPHQRDRPVAQIDPPQPHRIIGDVERAPGECNALQADEARILCQDFQFAGDAVEHIDPRRLAVGGVDGAVAHGEVGDLHGIVDLVAAIEVAGDQVEGEQGGAAGLAVFQRCLFDGGRSGPDDARAVIDRKAEHRPQPVFPVGKDLGFVAGEGFQQQDFPPGDGRDKEAVGLDIDRDTLDQRAGPVDLCGDFRLPDRGAVGSELTGDGFEARRVGRAQQVFQGLRIEDDTGPGHAFQGPEAVFRIFRPQGHNGEAAQDGGVRRFEVEGGFQQASRCFVIRIADGGIRLGEHLLGQCLRRGRVFRSAGLGGSRSGEQGKRQRKAQDRVHGHLPQSVPRTVSRSRHEAGYYGKYHRRKGGFAVQGAGGSDLRFRFSGRDRPRPRLPRGR